MKAQVAMLEAFASILLLLAAGAMTAGISYNMSISQKPSASDYQNMFYDFFDSAYSNASLAGCLGALNQSCGSYFLGGFAGVYGVKGASIEVNGRQAYSGSLAGCAYSKTECIPVAQNGTYLQVCLSACGG